MTAGLINLCYAISLAIDSLISRDLILPYFFSCCRDAFRSVCCYIASCYRDTFRYVFVVIPLCDTSRFVLLLYPPNILRALFIRWIEGAGRDDS